MNRLEEIYYWAKAIHGLKGLPLFTASPWPPALFRQATVKLQVNASQQLCQPIIPWDIILNPYILPGIIIHLLAILLFIY